MHHRNLSRFALAFLALPASAFADDATFRRGDADGSGRINITDPIRLLDALFLGEPAPTCLDAADANDDGDVDLSDAVAVLQYLFVGGRAPPPPFERCGTDPTADDLACGSFPACPSCGDCPEPHRCVPSGADGQAPSSICSADFPSCGEVIAHYHLLVGDFGSRCSDDVACRLVFGHCGVGIGGCYHAVGPGVTQEHLDALAFRFRELGCFGPVCDCREPPDVLLCREGVCEALWTDDGGGRDR